MLSDTGLFQKSRAFGSSLGGELEPDQLPAVSHVKKYLITNDVMLEVRGPGGLTSGKCPKDMLVHPNGTEARVVSDLRGQLRSWAFSIGLIGRPEETSSSSMKGK